MKKRLTLHFTLFSALLLFTAARSQPRGTVSGFVYDAETGEGLVGANVFLESTYIGSSTNSSGYYSLPRIAAGAYVLICQYIGYESHRSEITLQPRDNLRLNITLKPTTILTQEISVVADSVRTSVKLYRKPISKIQLRPKQIERIPQIVEADLLRSLHTMPGIASVSDFSSELYVRGGTPDQNLYLIDGTDVYNPEHLFGLFSTFNTDAIKSVEISKGGFGAEYGGRLSSVLDVTNLDGNRKEYTSKTSISLLSAKTTMQVPLGKIGALSGSIRRTYFDQTIAKTEALKNEDIPDYYFYDGHLKAYIDLGASDKLTIGTYKGYDDMEFQFDKDNPDSDEFLYDWGNTTASLRWTHIFSPVLFGNFWLTSSSFDSDFDFGPDINEVNDLDDRTFKGSFEYYHAQNLSFKTGFEYKRLHMLYRSEFPGGEVDVVQKPQHFALYLQSDWRPSPLLEIQSGLRYNRCSSNVRLHDIDPRLSLKYRLTETTNLKAALGSYHQYLFRIPRVFITDIWSSSDQYYNSAVSHHYIFGFQKEVAGDYEFELESYYKDYSNLYYYDPFFWVELRPREYNGAGEPLYRDTEGLFDRGQGHAYGLEMLLRKDSGILTGWFSATLGRVVSRVEGLNRNSNFVPRHDRTATVHLIGSLDLRNGWRRLRGRALADDGSSWRLGFGLVYATGQPLTTTSSIYLANQLPDQDFYHGYNLYPTSRNNFRLPPYARFDISLVWIKKFKNFRIEPFLQIFNAGNRKNVWFIEYEDELVDDRIIQNVDTTGMLPLLPSLGVNIVF